LHKFKLIVLLFVFYKIHPSKVNCVTKTKSQHHDCSRNLAYLREFQLLIGLNS